MGEKKIWSPSEMGKKGGKKSVASRFKGKTKEERSTVMREVRFSKQENKDLTAFGKASVKSLNDSVRLSKKEKKDFSKGVEEMVEGMRKTIR